MTVVGLTGGSGGGKSTALRALRDLGAVILDCDGIYHRLLSEDGETAAEIIRAFPDAGKDGRVDRRALAAEVFGDEAALLRLDSITHPAVARRVDAELEKARPDGRELAVIEAIALFESGLSERCGATFFVRAPRGDRIRRVMARDGIGEKAAEARIDAQKPDGFFEERCDFTLDNNFPDSEGFYRYCLGEFRRFIKNG